MLNGYASPGTKVEIGFPDDFEGSQVFQTIGNQSLLNGLHHMMETPATESGGVATGFAAAVDALARGKLVAMPTETVYGLAADATNAERIRGKFALQTSS